MYRWSIIWSIGGIQPQPLEPAGLLWRPHRGPGMSGIDADHPILSGGRVGGQIPGHVTGRQPVGSQAGDRQPGKVLTYPFPGGQNLTDPGGNRRRPRPVGEVGEDARREIPQHLDQRAPGREAGRRVVADVVGDLRRIQVQAELGRQALRRARPAGTPPTAAPPARWCTDRGPAEYTSTIESLVTRQGAVRLGDVEVGTDVAVAVGAGRAVGGRASCRWSADGRRNAAAACPAGSRTPRP